MGDLGDPGQRRHQVNYLCQSKGVLVNHVERFFVFHNSSERAPRLEKWTSEKAHWLI